MKRIDLRKLFKQARGNFGHKGRPGKVGGSLPQGGNGSLYERARQEKSYQDYEKHISDAFKKNPKLREIDMTPVNLGRDAAKDELKSPRTFFELKRAVKKLNGSGDLRRSVGKTLEDSGFRYEASFQGAGSPSTDLYIRGNFDIEVSFENNYTKVSASRRK